MPRPMTIKSAVALTATIVATLCAPAAMAATRLTFAGLITDGGGTAVATGDRFSGSLIYDEAVAALGGSDANTAVYNALVSTSFTITTGGTDYAFTSSNPAEIQLGNQGGGEATDRFAVVVRGLTGPAIAGSQLTVPILRVDDSSGARFGAANAGLPTQFTLGDFDSNGVFLFFDGSFSGAASGRLTRFDSALVAGVPEAATWAMLVGGFGLAGGALRRRRQVAIA